MTFNQLFIKEIPPENEVDILSKKLNINPLLSKILLQRGINSFENAKQFFRPNFSDIHNPFLMLNMSKAIERIEKALKRKEKILIYGDYDVDGTTAVALVYDFLVILLLK